MTYIWPRPSNLRANLLVSLPNNSPTIFIFEWGIHIDADQVWVASNPVLCFACRLNPSVPCLAGLRRPKPMRRHAGRLDSSIPRIELNKPIEQWKKCPTCLEYYSCCFYSAFVIFCFLCRRLWISSILYRGFLPSSTQVFFKAAWMLSAHPWIGRTDHAGCRPAGRMLYKQSAWLPPPCL